MAYLAGSERFGRQLADQSGGDLVGRGLGDDLLRLRIGRLQHVLPTHTRLGAHRSGQRSPMLVFTQQLTIPGTSEGSREKKRRRDIAP